jgi:hypothetical protein
MLMLMMMLMMIDYLKWIVCINDEHNGWLVCA